MKKILSVLFIGLLTISMSAQQKKAEDKATDPNAAKFEFESEVIDYGKIALNSDGIRVFKFKNVGKSPLTIKKISSSCGCTVPKKPEKPIMPGETGQIEVKYDTKKPGGFSKTITIQSDASEPVKRLRIKGIVLKPESAGTKTTKVSS